MIYAESGNIGVSTCMIAEATAIWKALNFCILQGFQNVSLEMDSLCLSRILLKV